MLMPFLPGVLCIIQDHDIFTWTRGKAAKIGRITVLVTVLISNAHAFKSKCVASYLYAWVNGKSSFWKRTTVKNGALIMIY